MCVACVMPLSACSSRKGTIDAATAIVKEAEAHAQVASYSGSAGTTSTGSTFVRDVQQLQRLRTASANTQAKALASLLVAGVGFHNAAMEPADRALVEDLFKANDLAVSA
jgi:ATP-dependent DNA helicase HFM1/MER3